MVTAAQKCQHKRGKWVSAGTDYETGEPLPDVYAEEFTYEDLDVGRFRCTQCGEVGYYTGQWRAYHEHGTPCIGSEGVERVIPNAGVG